MSTTQTLRESKAERLRSNPAPQNIAEAEEEESNIEWFRGWCRRCNEWRAQEGLPYEDPITMEEIVAIVKEVRAEMYAEEQERKNAVDR